MQIDENKVVGFRTADGWYTVFIKDTPKIVGRGRTADEALSDLNDKYSSIIRAVQYTSMKNPENRYG